MELLGLDSASGEYDSRGDGTNIMGWHHRVFTLNFEFTTCISTTMRRIQPENDPPNLPEASATPNFTIDLIAMRSISEPICSSSMSIMTEHATPHTESGRAALLSHLNFHSPSAIVGTPLDHNSRFEYPFPSPEILDCSSFLDVPVRSASAALIPRIPEQWKQSSLRHPKHLRQDAPIPPTLARKRPQFDLDPALDQTSVHDVMAKGCIKSPRRRKMEAFAVRS